MPNKYAAVVGATISENRGRKPGSVSDDVKAAIATLDGLAEGATTADDGAMVFVAPKTIGNRESAGTRSVILRWAEVTGRTLVKGHPATCDEGWLVVVAPSKAKGKR